MGNTVIQTRNDTASNWTTNNPTLALGEIGLETDTKRMKVGDGSTAWNSLGYYGVGAIFKYGEYALSANQTTGLSVGSNIAFDTKVVGSLNSPSSGVITLPAGKTYKITLIHADGYSNAASSSAVQMYNITASSFFGMKTHGICTAYGSPYHSSQPALVSYITTTENTEIEARIVTSNYLSTIYANPTRLIIEEYGGY